MKLLFDFFPIVLFFLAYKFGDLMIATQTAIAASLVQVLWLRFRTGEFPKMQLISFFAILILGGATLVLQDELFVKWKPTAVYWLLGLIFLGSHFIGEQTLIERLAQNSVHLPAKIWRQLNLSWTIFFVLMGVTNLYVVYHFETKVWVNFKLFGTLGLTLLFIIGQAIYMAKHSELNNGNS